MKPVTVDILRTFEALKNVPDDQLEWLIEKSRHYVLKEGEFLFKPGEPFEGTHYFISGRIRIYMVQNNSTREFGFWEKGDMTGYLPYSRGKETGGYAETTKEAQIMTFPIELMREMIRDKFELTQALVHAMTDRVRNFTALQQQNEKMMALGKLSAGLAHELNNPAAAIVRGSEMLQKHLQSTPDSFKKVTSIKMTEEEVDTVNNKLFTILDKEKPALSMMEKSDLEDEMTDWLDDEEVDNAFDIAENLVEYGFTVEDMEEFKSLIPKDHQSAVYNWINSNIVTDKMVADIQDSSQRISDLVGAVKNFTHMDRGQDKEYFDIHSGIQNTVKMLDHKIRKAGVEFIEDYDSSLPNVKARVGELNQVWTNLIDNAIDAMDDIDKPILEIKTEKDGKFVKVLIIDNGKGIPEDIVSQIFDPFFTTKDIGKGTGLGLDVVNRIVEQHNGTIKVNSKPGRTEFMVCFPIDG